MVGVRELKNRLSQMLRLVKAGESLVITERGRAIARVTPECWHPFDEMQALADMAAQGLVRLPEDVPREEPDFADIRGRPLSETVREGRR